jgi:ATP phosphoribosyltransferase
MTQSLDLAHSDPDPDQDPGGAAPSGVVMALPKGRILADCLPLLRRMGVEPPPDVATFVAFGAAEIGICGADVLMEFDYSEIYAPLDLGIGRCRVSVAEPAETAGADDSARWSRVRVATKYPNIARRHYAARGIHAEVVHLSGAMELAPRLGLSRLIVDLVQTGSTLKANGLVETEVIAPVTSRLIVNRAALKTRPEVIGAWIARFRQALAQMPGGDAA